MAMLQHGCAIVATSGPLTDDMLKQEAGRSFLLTDVANLSAFTEAVAGLAKNTDQQQQLSRHAREFYGQEFAWPKVAERLLLVFSKT